MTLRTNNGVLEVLRGSQLSDVRVRDLFTSGKKTSIESEEVLIADSFLTLNSKFKGSTATENAGLEIFRDTVNGGNAIIQWNEAKKVWEVGLGTQMSQIARTVEGVFSAADLQANKLQIAHPFGDKFPLWSIWRSDGKSFDPDVEATDGILTFDFEDVTVNGTWKYIIVG